MLVETKDNTYRMISLPNWSCSLETDIVSFVADVPTNEKMWVEIRAKCGSSFSADCFERMTIHIHTPKEVEGGGWNHGKFGSGNTSVIK